MPQVDKSLVTVNEPMTAPDMARVENVVAAMKAQVARLVPTPQPPLGKSRITAELTRDVLINVADLFAQGLTALAGGTDLGAVCRSMAGKADAAAVTSVQASVAAMASLVAQKAPQSAVDALTAGVDQKLAPIAAALAAKADKTAVPAAATTMPPGVSVAGEKGTSPQYALADHTHATSVQRQRVTLALAGSTGRAVWTFPTPYPAGTVPVVHPTAETPDTALYFLDARILAGSVTNTQCTVVVNKVNASVVAGVLGAVLSVFAPATGSVTVHLSAAKPTAV